MRRGNRRRSYEERRTAIAKNLRRVISEMYGLPQADINDSTPLGYDYLSILNLVAEEQGRPPLKNHVSMSADSTVNEALAFLLTAVQS